MKEGDMGVVADFFDRILMRGEDPEKVKKDVIEFRKEFQEVVYTWKEEDLEGYLQQLFQPR